VASKVGVGTNSPLDRFTIKPTSTDNLGAFTITNTAGTYTRIKVGLLDSDAIIQLSDDGGTVNIQLYAASDKTSFILGNFGIGQTTFGTNATKTLAIGTGTAPTTSPADSFQMYSADIVAGNAAPHFRLEGDDIIKLYKYIDADFGNAINSGDADTDDAISAIISALTAHGLIAAA